MTATARGRHRKLRRNILHTLIATALLAGTFTAVDQSLNIKPAAAAAGEPGSLDVAISTDATNSVAVQSNGGIIAGLSASPYVRRYSLAGVRDTTFTSTTTEAVGAVAVQPDDKVLSLGGWAVSVGGMVRNLATGGADSSWTKESARTFNEDGRRVIAQLSNGSIAVGGYFDADRLHLLGANGIRNSTFSTNVALNPVPNMPSTVLIQNDGGTEKILVGGYSSGGGFLRRYNIDGTLDTSFTSGTGYSPYAMTLMGSGSDARIVAFIGYATAAGYTSNKLAVFQTNGVRDTTSALATALASQTFSAEVKALAVDATGNLLVGGAFTGKLRRYTSTGAPDTLFNTNSAGAVTGDVRSIAFYQPARKVLLATSAGLISVNGDYANPGPTFNSAAVSVDGLSLTLEFSTALSSTPPAGSSFAVTRNAVAVPVTNVTVSGTQATLTLASTIGAGQAVTIAYTAPARDDATTNAAIQTTLGGDSLNFTVANSQVTNNSTVDRVSPTYTASSAVVATDGMSMTLTYNEALSSVTAPPSAFTVTSGGIGRTVTSVATDGSKVVLYFASPLSQVATTTVAYSAPTDAAGTSNSAVQDIAGNDAATLASVTAVNNSTVDATGPTYTAGTATLDSTGLNITLTYNEALHARTADPSAFTVTSGASTRSVTDVTVSGSTLTLTLASPIAAGATVTVSYAAPTASALTSNLAIQDTYGNDSGSLNSVAITNNSVIDFALAPNLTGIAAPSTTKIILSFDKALNSTTAATTDFNVSSAGIPISVTSLAIVGSTVELTLASAMSTTYQTFVTYTAPTPDATTGNSAIQSSVGNDAASFVKQAVDLLATGTTVTEVVTAPTASPGQKIDLIARMPFTQTGSTSQEIVQQIDPSVIQLTGINDIAYPNGWTLSYCSGLSTDCTVAGNFSTTAPTTAAAWALVKAVKATGNVVSDGTSGGNLIATATATDTSPRQGSFTSTSTGIGDGWLTGFDNRGNVYNMFHHDGNNNYSQGALDCHTRTGAACPGPWPFYVGNVGLHTMDQSYFYVDVDTNRVFFPTDKSNGASTSTSGRTVSQGVGCIDVSAISAPTLCGGSVSTGYTALMTYPVDYAIHKGSSNMAVYQNRIYFNDTRTGVMNCFDTKLNGGLGAACPGQPFAVQGVTSAGNGETMLRNVGGKLFGAAADKKAFCFDPSTNTMCAGWETSKTLAQPSYRVLELPNASGNLAAVCFITGDQTKPNRNTSIYANPIPYAVYCFTATGGAYTTPSWLTSYFAVNQGSHYFAAIVNSPEVNGTKIYWSNNEILDGWKYYCYDVALNSGTGGVCPNFPINQTPPSTGKAGGHASYTLVLDPQNSNCLWVNNDASQITTYDAITGQLGCTSPPSTVTFSGATTVPRLSCTDENGVRAWRNVTLKTPGAANYSAVKLTVVDSAGNAVAGYTDITTSLTNASGQKYWDLTGLPVSMTGQTPNFKVQFIGLSGTTDASISISAEGGSPQLCLTPVTVVKCPTGFGVLDQSALTATNSTVTGSGSSTVGGTTTALTSSSSTVSITAPSLADCSSSLRGRAGYSGNGGTGDPVAGATVSLLDSSGQPVLDAQNNPITTVTGSDGRYAFNNLYPGSYKVAFQAPADKSLISATTVSGASGSTFATTNTSSTTVTATTSAVAVGTYAVVNSLYMVAMTANPDTTSGLKGQTQTINLITNPDVTGTDVPSQGATVLADSVKLCDTTETSPNCTKTSVTVSGVGTYSVDANGLMTFTPLANYTGTPTPLAYTVMDTSGGTGASTYTPTVIGSPTATADTTSGPLNIAQSINVLTNTAGTSDSAGSGASLVASSLTLSCPATPTTPTCSVSGGAVTIAGQGTYTKATDGTVTFTQ
jgi:uncharacterized repeat protein (TIGR02059 family)